MEITEINLTQWKRRDTYKLFREAQNPFFSLTSDIDVTPFMRHYKKQGLVSFNFTLFSIMRAVNAIDELKTRFEGDRVFQSSKTSPSFTVPIENEGFAFCEVEYDDDWSVFNARCLTQISAAKQQKTLKENVHSNYWTYLSCMPWINFTGAAHPTMNADDCIPRIVWGKYIDHGDKWTMALNLQAHHALLDGVHIAQFFLKTEQFMAEFPETTIT